VLPTLPGSGCTASALCCLERRGESGVDVMITIFGDFYKFSTKNLAFSLKNKVMMQILQKISVVLAKTPFLQKKFGENIFKTITVVQAIF
jgi:hypothetical protein